MMRVAHVITGLTSGGAQAMLYKLLSCMDRSEFDADVVSLREGGPLLAPIEQLGVRVHTLGMHRGAGSLTGVFRLAAWLRRESIDLVQCWLYHGDLVGGVAGRLAGLRRIIWGIRQSTLDLRGTRSSTVWTVRACGRLSRTVPSRIVCCSSASRLAHVDLGYDPTRMVVIPNGFDLEAFRPEPSCRAAVRRELGIPDSAPVIGLVARFHPQKDHPTFLEAARAVADRSPETHFILCGGGVEAESGVLARRIASLDLDARVHLLGERTDVARLTAAFDIACSASFAEGFPNAIGEAMACGVPCVVTDVGDSGKLVGDTGRVVPAENPRALADALAVLIDLAPEERRRLGAAARRRIEQHYSLPAVAERYAALYREVLAE